MKNNLLNTPASQTLVSSCKPAKTAGILLLFSFIFWLPLQAQLERDSVQIIMDIQELRQPKLADLDGDGDLDIIGTRLGYDGHLAFYENTDGQGTLALPKIFGDSVWGTPNPNYNFLLADMDNDGDVDIVDGHHVLAEFPFWENDGQANFSLTNPSDDDNLNDYYPFRIVDLNGDGWKDILYYFDSNRRLYIKQNQGPGFPFITSEIAWLGFNEYFEDNELLVADFDQDGDQDIWVISTFAYDLPEGPYKTLRLELVEMENGSSLTTHEADLAYGEDSQYIINASTSDLNGDGFPDLIVTNDPFGYPDDSGMMLFRNMEGTGQFTLETTFPKPIFHTIADIDGDGDEDIISLSVEDNFNSADEYTYEWWENNGNFDPTPHLIDSTFTGYYLMMEDLNQDGLPDLITSNTINSSLILTKDQSQVFCRFANSMPGNFEPPTPLTEAFSYMRDFTVKDWNGDGQLDVLFAAESGISWIENLENGTNFSPPSHLWETTIPLGEFTFDQLNQDGLPDGIGTLPIPGSIYWQLFAWLGDTTNAAAPPTLFTNFQLLSADDYTLGDLDGDNDQDIIAANDEGNLIIVWNEFDSGGTFSTETTTISLPEASSALRQIILEDINQDGNGDLVVHSTNRIYYALQLDNAGTFEDWNIISSPFVVGPVLAGDYDNDGDVDLRYKISENYDYYAVISRFDAISQQFLAPVNTLFFNIAYPWWQEDFNSDGIQDVVQDVGYSLSIGNSGFITEPYLPTPFNNRLPHSLSYNPKKADIDNDGKDELITGITSLISYDLDFLESTTVDGLVAWDTTANCTFDSLHPPLADWKLLLSSGTQQQLTTTGVNGHYGLFVPDFDEHLLQPIPPSDYWTVCPPDTTLTGDGPFNVHFTATANTLCPLLELDMSISTIRQCFPSHVSLSYRNKGTVPATPASITLTYDPRMTPVSSTPSWSIMTDTSLVYLFDEIGVGEEGQIMVEMEPDCQNLVLGEILCYHAAITPDTLCDPMLAEWGGPNLEASYFCADDSLSFRVENTGYGPMNAPEAYQLNIVNDDIVLLQMGDIQLEPGEADTFRVATSLESYLLTVDQPDGHPNPEPISLITGGCLAPLDTALLNAFPNNDGDGFAVDRCGPVVGPYDPNIKVAVPEGFGEQRLIKADQAIQYTIHFQNVGTDMARQVTIRDTLSNQLDIATFQPGPASHTHEWAILPDRSLTITFPEINLPDSTSNEPGSHGHFSFTIKPVEGILPHTVIQNEAAIYFDFNPPVITNKTNHTILKPVVSSAVFATLCPGDTYIGQVIEQDTILKEIHEMTELDSIIWHHLNVLTIEDTTHIFVSLEGPEEWQGQFIVQDTLIAETLMSTLGCDSIVAYHIMILTETQEPAWAADVQLSPNPTHSIFQLSWNNLPSGPKAVRVYQITGRVMETRALSDTDQAVTWDASQWPAGSYWVELEVDGERMRWRVVVV